MKANEAPEKIYLYPSDRAGENYEDEWGDKPWGEDYVEYIQTDAFIEKACDWLMCHPSSHYDDLEEFLNAFRKVMKRD